VMKNRGKKQEEQKDDTKKKKEGNSQSSLSPFLIFGALVILGIAAFVYYQQTQKETSEIEVPKNLEVNDKEKKDESKPTKRKIKEKKDSKKASEKIFTANELKQYDGDDPKKPIYVAVFGQVFDVTKGVNYYGKGSMYSGFAGKDGSRAFVTGEFTPEGFRDDIDGLTPIQVADIYHWIDFYKTHPKYFYVGKLHGRYYNEKGEPTEEVAKLEEVLKEAARQKEDNENEKKKFPGCNSNWSQESGGKVWCEDMSGGIKRDWGGLPRKRFSDNKVKCVCASPETINDPSLSMYDNCPPDSFGILRQVMQKYQENIFLLFLYESLEVAQSFFFCFE